MTTKHEVIAAYHAHPEWSSADIAISLGCRSEYVRATMQRNKLAPRHTIKASGPRRSLRLAVPVIEGLSEPASLRCISPLQLANDILAIVVRENMIDAILDDAAASGAESRRTSNKALGPTRHGDSAGVPS